VSRQNFCHLRPHDDLEINEICKHQDEHNQNRDHAWIAHHQVSWRFSLSLDHDELDLAQKPKRYKDRSQHDRRAESNRGVVRDAEEQVNDERRASQRTNHRIVVLSQWSTPALEFVLLSDVAPPLTNGDKKGERRRRDGDLG
jgi:hypothetical protein